MTTAIATTSATFEFDRDAKRKAFERNDHVTQTIKSRARNQREFRHAQAEQWNTVTGTVSVQVAPKWRRHQEEYINPHLLEHERPIIAPRYGTDAPCRNVRARDDKCRCDYCMTSRQTREDEKRGAEKVLRKLVTPGRAGVRNAGKGPWVDWDVNGCDCFSYDGDQDWLIDYEDDKQAPVAQIDLLAIAKPAKGKKKLARQGTVQSLARPALKVSGLSSIDEISILDFEETWEHLDLDHLDISAFTHREPEEGSEWDWDRLSQF